MIRFFFTVALLIFITPFFFAQNIEALEEQVAIAEENGEYDKVNSLYRKLQKRYREQENWSQYAEQYLWIGQNYFFNFEEFDQLKHYSDSALSFVQQHDLSTNHSTYSLIWNHYGYYFNYIGDTENSIEAFERDLEISIELSNSDKEYDRTALGEAYLNIGSQYSNLGDYDQAMDYYQRAIEEFEKNSNRIADTYNNLAFDLQRKKEFRDSKSYYEQALKILKKLPNDQENLDTELRVYKSLVTLSNDQEKYDSAYHYLDQVKQRIRSNEQLELAWYFTVLGGTDLFLKNFDSAKGNFHKGLKLYQEILPDQHPFLSSCYKEIGELYADMDEQERAISYFQRAMIALIPDFKDTLIDSNPSLINNIDDKLELIQILDHKAKSLKIIGNFRFSQSTLQLAIQLIDQIRYNYLAEGSKYALLERAMPVYEQAIDLAIEMGELEWALEVSERSKATLLLESIKNSEAQTFAGISEELLEQERERKVQIAFYERLLNEAEEEEEQTKYQRELFDLRQKYQTFLAELEQAHPEYYELKYELEYPSVSELKGQLLDDNTALLEYFTGDSSIYLFVVTKEDLQVQTLGKTADFETNLSTLRNSLNQVSANSFVNFTASSYFIYSNFLQESLNKLPSKINQILLVPDGQLSYIPFQVLIQYPVNQSSISDPRFDTLSYLVQDYTISYAYSSTLLLKNQIDEKQQDLTFGGFAPIFSGGTDIPERSSRKVLSELPFSQTEIKNIHALIGGQTHLQSDASLANFKNQAAYFNILHLSTHAAVDDENPAQSRIYFHDDYLTVNEIYNLPIHADLTVLSACETGVGEYKRGEGMLSLARAFMYAGCPSLVTSLWQVNDEKTANLMLSFYEELLKKQLKNQALQQAQINYLKTASMEAAHPFYWAAFVQVGDRTAVVENGVNWSWLLVFGGIGSLLIFFFFNRKLKRKNS